MALSRIENEILVYRQSLEKAVADEGEKNSEMMKERILDILKSLKQLSLTSEMIRCTKIGLCVNNIKKRYDGEIGKLARELIHNWKSIYHSQSTSENISPVKGKKNSDNVAERDGGDETPVSGGTITPSEGEVNEQSVSTTNHSPRPDLNDGVFGKLELDSLPEARRNIITLLLSAFEPDIADGIQREVLVSIARGIELTLNNRHSFTGDRENYQTKARKLIFNLKKNKEIRMNILDGFISLADLITLPSTKLATKELSDQRNAAVNEASESRRSDWIAANRDRVMRDNGLDPSKGTEFKCHKCRSSKCTFYALQTRSSDEPMTLFVTCLNCGNNWKTS